MSQNRTDTAFRPKRPPPKDLAAPQLRALRKELLLVRADVERMELAEATFELKQAVTHFRWLRFLLPMFGQGGARSASIGLLLKDHPLVGSLLSLLLAKPLRAGLVKGAKPALKWGAVALGAWEAFRIWRQVQAEKREAEESADAADGGMGISE
ncbi:DUF3318 domain-containing protein [Paraburkholderia kururiensis]|jgi:hypothetical protein|uniref:DUF3318 domain-containing protein n=1 Tax=Paraburkholderia kururiensis TaxID=984307 RepID=A0ABZ0WHB5_9BURK|nr:DUF3318 domain-containing protein [Paraburkholderia kururiensis]WQD76770.1 DUF3318 domain-containing protein [Paraburkholderia kururiensis]